MSGYPADDRFGVHPADCRFGLQLPEIGHVGDVDPRSAFLAGIEQIAVGIENPQGLYRFRSGYERPEPTDHPGFMAADRRLMHGFRVNLHGKGRADAFNRTKIGTQVRFQEQGQIPYACSCRFYRVLPGAKNLVADQRRRQDDNQQKNPSVTRFQHGGETLADIGSGNNSCSRIDRSCWGGGSTLHAHFF
ncbi:MAG: hypothetical protein NT123_19030 [Proteobacteria bacterium]|nr:hypothetical protein [Pseudomonadota bacterium]